VETYRAKDAERLASMLCVDAIPWRSAPNSLFLTSPHHLDMRRELLGQAILGLVAGHALNG